MIKKALVLAGGGSRGAYQLGVWRAAKELGIDFSIVTGASVGALNGALIVQDDYELAKKLWENISSANVIKLDGISDALDDLSDSHNRKQVLRAFAAEAVGKGGADIAPLAEMIDQYLSEDKFRKSPIDFGLITVEYPSFNQLELTKEDIPEGMIADFLLASAACYPAFRAKEIDGVQYIDGGYYDNMPINLAIKMGAEEVIAVDLNGIGFKRRITDKQVPVTYIRSYWHLGNFLLFEKEFALRNISLGYNDAMKAFGQLEGFAYTFEKGETKKNALLLNAAFKEAFLRTKQLTVGRTPAVLLKLITKLILGDLRKRRNLSQTITITEMFTASGEVCAEFFNIDPLPIYTMEQFNSLILEQYNEIRQNTEEKLFELIGTGLTVKEIIHLITQLDKSDIVWFIHQRFEAFLDGNAKEADLAVLCGAFTAETAAAFYLGLILR